MTLVEAIAVVFGIACVWLTLRQSIWCWPTGLVQVVLYVYIFYEVKLYSDLLLHLVYIVLQIYGWHHWLRGDRRGNELPVTTVSNVGRASLAAGAVVGTAALGYLMATYTDAALPYADAFTTVVSLLAQWLLTQKRLESWVLWIMVDVVAIGVYWYKELWLTCGLYAVFLVLAVCGLIAWRNAWRSSLHDNWIDPRQVCPAAPGASVGD